MVASDIVRLKGFEGGTKRPRRMYADLSLENRALKDVIKKYITGGSVRLVELPQGWDLAGLEGGGFHFRGESSRGKTTTLHVAGSVWGGGDMGGYIKTWRGTGKARARQDGLGAPQSRWRTLFLSTGEVALADKMAEAGRRTRAGQEARKREPTPSTGPASRRPSTGT